MFSSAPSLMGAIVLLLMLAVAITVLIWEVFVFFRGRTIISRSRLVWRIVGLLLIVAVLFGMFAGVYLIRFPDRLTAIRYWSVYLVLSFVTVAALIFMAFRDWRWLMSEQFQRKMELYHKLGDDLRKLSRSGLSSEEKEQS